MDGLPGEQTGKGQVSKAAVRTTVTSLCLRSTSLSAYLSIVHSISFYIIIGLFPVSSLFIQLRLQLYSPEDSGRATAEENGWATFPAAESKGHEPMARGPTAAARRVRLLERVLQAVQPAATPRIDG